VIYEVQLQAGATAAGSASLSGPSRPNFVAHDHQRIAVVAPQSGPVPRLAERIGPEADPARIAEVFVSTFREIEAALCPVIGRGGVTALNRRCFYLVSAAYPWLRGTGKSRQTLDDVAAIGSVLAQQTSALAFAGSGALLRAFVESLVGLIGSSLTGQLLGSVRTHGLGGLPAAPGGLPAKDTET